MRESKTERKSREWAASQEWLTRKFKSVNNRSVPDRVFIKDGRVVFIEFKQAEKDPTDPQQREIARFRAAGAEVHVARSLEDAKKILTEPGDM